MSAESRVTTPAEDAFCSIERTLGIVGERWTLLILREALTNGATRFDEFTEVLGIAPNILATRLKTLVESGVLEKREYRVEGSRARMSYHPTEAGTQLLVVLGALGQWGDDHVPPARGVTATREAAGTPLRVGFVDDPSVLKPVDEVRFVRTPSHPRYDAA
ncbi:DNA-binding HxlR family transcriptional regulator [Diaminobutyricimonas aerilata]|uniref:DNA-binding HxlR family transcriptional regulator n=1 Tax=Diaminobutyricimonas aerilata TaxID=1162967 RepID=A0A2M9CLN8_9MICO|nr:helix-turn-helix domain-containing protein [Diaminobutyricimonas aerilata]PJJ72815.1 DNA-binding HxlR family transcriptional regulator [Diaminobutyricimonas aerilata]